MTISTPMPAALCGARVAIVHDYLNQVGGAENVVLVFADMFPGAPIFTSVYDAERMGEPWNTFDIRTSFMQRISPRLGVAKALLPLYPTAFESFDLSAYDLVLSFTTAFAKGVITRPDTLHVCYCSNPTRFLWMYDEYVRFERLPPGAGALLPWLATPMRMWDFAAAQRVDQFVASAHNVKRRIAKYYRRSSEVIHAPIDASRFAVAPSPEDYFLVVSRLQSYKRIDLAVEACSWLGLPLHVVGDGPDRARLQAMAGPTVRFFGRLGDVAVQHQMAHCRAFLFPGEEDFGLTPLEAQASGRPVIAYAGGGALETVIEGVTGRFFNEQTVQSLRQILENFEDAFEPHVLRDHAMQFDKSVFARKLYALLATQYEAHRQLMVPEAHSP